MKANNSIPATTRPNNAMQEMPTDNDKESILNLICPWRPHTGSNFFQQEHFFAVFHIKGPSKSDGGCLLNSYRVTKKIRTHKNVVKTVKNQNRHFSFSQHHVQDLHGISPKVQVHKYIWSVLVTVLENVLDLSSSPLATVFERDTTFF